MDLTKNTNKNENVESTRGYFYEKPLCDIYETDQEYKIIFDLPGIEKKDIDIKIEKDILTVTAESAKKPVEGYGCINDEYDFTGYKRSFNLNSTVDTDKVKADHVNGVLTLTLPKREEQKTKEIKVNIA